MIVFPNAKINLGLHVLRRRSDGYHDIETCFYPVPLTDILEVVESPEMHFGYSGLPIPGNTSDNLVQKAYDLLNRAYGLPPVSIHLHKVIPMGAGLGGGSSDAAFMLTALNDLFKLGLTADELANYAGKLGSDCPFFIYQSPSLGKGTGTTLLPLPIQLAGKHIAIIHPGIHVSTAEAYARLNPAENRRPIQEILHQESWRDHLVNDFTPHIYDTHPEIAAIERVCYEAGAMYACMSGSGSAVFALSESVLPLDFPSSYFTWQGILS
jgi:4-diphosphocytidyl-2-C-methyl-D-erythritol kinase